MVNEDGKIDGKQQQQQQQQKQDEQSKQNEDGDDSGAAAAAAAAAAESGGNNGKNGETAQQQPDTKGEERNDDDGKDGNGDIAAESYDDTLTSGVEPRYGDLSGSESGEEDDEEESESEEEEDIEEIDYAEIMKSGKSLLDTLLPGGKKKKKKAHKDNYIRELHLTGDLAKDHATLTALMKTRNSNDGGGDDGDDDGDNDGNDDGDNDGDDDDDSDDSDDDDNKEVVSEKETKKNDAAGDSASVKEQPLLRRPAATSKEDMLLPLVEDFGHIDVPKSGKLLEAGSVSANVGTRVVVQGALQQNPQAIDQGTILLLEDRTPIGIIDEVFGPVKEPFYVLRYNTEEDVNSKLHVGKKVFYLGEMVKFVLAAAVKDKGTDASTINDQEVTNPKEMDFSDDEEERRVKASLKKKARQQHQQDADGERAEGKENNNSTKRKRHRSSWQGGGNHNYRGRGRGRGHGRRQHGGGGGGRGRYASYNQYNLPPQNHFPPPALHHPSHQYSRHPYQHARHQGHPTPPPPPPPPYFHHSSFRQGAPYQGNPRFSQRQHQQHQQHQQQFNGLPDTHRPSPFYNNNYVPPPNGPQPHGYPYHQTPQQ